MKHVFWDRIDTDKEILLVEYVAGFVVDLSVLGIKDRCMEFITVLASQRVLCIDLVEPQPGLIA